VFNSAWLGSMMTLVSTLFVSLVGFYIVKNAILRDEQTRVGRILASTPMSRVFYTLAKSLSNFVVLALMVAVLAGTALFTQFLRAEDTTLPIRSAVGSVPLGRASRYGHHRLCGCAV
jgi:hypothetical protein